MSALSHVFFSAFIRPTVPTVIIAAAIGGYGDSLIWIGQVPSTHCSIQLIIINSTQGALLVECSTPATHGRNSGIFWLASFINV